MRATRYDAGHLVCRNAVANGFVLGKPSRIKEDSRNLGEISRGAAAWRKFRSVKRRRTQNPSGAEALLAAARYESAPLYLPTDTLLGDVSATPIRTTARSSSGGQTTRRCAAKIYSAKRSTISVPAVRSSLAAGEPFPDRQALADFVEAVSIGGRHPKSYACQALQLTSWVARLVLAERPEIAVRDAQKDVARKVANCCTRSLLLKSFHRKKEKIQKAKRKSSCAGASKARLYSDYAAEET